VPFVPPSFHTLCYTQRVIPKLNLFSAKYQEIRGLCRLLEVCSELADYKYESAMNITDSSSTIASVCLARIYENMYYDAAKLKFVEQIDEYIKDKLLSPDMESKVRVTVAITALLNGPLDVGNQVVARDGELYYFSVTLH